MITDAIKKMIVISAGLLIVSVIVGEVLLGVSFAKSMAILIVPYIKAVYGILILIVLIDIAISLEKISAKPKE
jgi:hypothetical protein